jgi:hypothetical protein
MTRIDYNSLCTVPIGQCANGKSFGDATAFVWKRGPQHYLITNWHVVTGRNAETNELETPVQPDMLKALFNSRIPDFGKIPRDINIRDDANNPLWFTHPLRQRGSDVVAIPLPIAGDDPIINMYPINAAEPDVDLAVRIAMDVFILGYPFGAPPPGFPVWKRGSIASEPDLVHFGKGCLLIDTASRKGMSGAPVIRRSWTNHLMEDGTNLPLDATSRTRFIGVYSGRFHTKNPEDAQLGMVWPVRDIQDIVDGAKLDS